jgi:hypothetical protein
MNAQQHGRPLEDLTTYRNKLGVLLVIGFTLFLLLFYCFLATHSVDRG